MFIVKCEEWGDECTRIRGKYKGFAERNNCACLRSRKKTSWARAKWAKGWLDGITYIPFFQH